MDTGKEPSGSACRPLNHEGIPASLFHERKRAELMFCWFGNQTDTISFGRQEQKTKDERRMIHYIKGKYTGTFRDGIVIETGGIGFEVHVPAASRFYTQTEGTEITAYTALLVREDDMSLYGFSERQDLTVFRLLTTVTGVGAKAAMSMLSALSASEICRAILYEDADQLTRAPGIGKKTANRIVLELKDKIDGLEGLSEMPSETGTAENRGADDPQGGSSEEAILALISLGFPRNQAADAVASSGEPDEPVEELIRRALKYLSKY